MTIPNNTTAKLIGLAACGAAALGLSLDAALLTRTEDLLAALTAAGLLPTATRQPAEEEPAGHTTPVAEPPTQPRPAAPVEEERTRLIRPGMTIPAGDVDPEDESLYI